MREIFWISNANQLLIQWYQRSSQQNGKTIMISPWPFWRYWYMSEWRFPPSELGRIPFRTLLTGFSPLDFTVLICLVWHLSPGEAIPLEVSLSFKRTLQLSTSMMTVSITIVQSSLSGMTVSVGNAAVGVLSLKHYFPFSYSSVSQECLWRRPSIFMLWKLSTKLSRFLYLRFICR